MWPSWLDTACLSPLPTRVLFQPKTCHELKLCCDIKTVSYSSHCSRKWQVHPFIPKSVGGAVFNQMMTVCNFCKEEVITALCKWEGIKGRCGWEQRSDEGLQSTGSCLCLYEWWRMCWAILIQMFQATLQLDTDYTILILKRNLGTEQLLTHKFIIFHKKNKTGEKKHFQRCWTKCISQNLLSWISMECHFNSQCFVFSLCEFVTVV